MSAPLSTVTVWGAGAADLAGAEGAGVLPAAGGAGVLTTVVGAEEAEGAAGAEGAADRGVEAGAPAGLAGAAPAGRVGPRGLSALIWTVSLRGWLPAGATLVMFGEGAAGLMAAGSAAPGAGAAGMPGALTTGAPAAGGSGALGAPGAGGATGLGGLGTPCAETGGAGMGLGGGGGFTVLFSAASGAPDCVPTGEAGIVLAEVAAETGGRPGVAVVAAVFFTESGGVLMRTVCFEGAAGAIDVVAGLGAGADGAVGGVGAFGTIAC